MSSIISPELSGQMAADVYKQLLKIVQRDARNMSRASQSCNWRFQPPERTPKANTAIRAYWGDLFKDEIKALDQEWATPRESTPITADVAPTGADDVSIHQAS